MKFKSRNDMFDTLEDTSSEDVVDTKINKSQQKRLFKHKSSNQKSNKSSKVKADDLRSPKKTPYKRTQKYKGAFYEQ